MRYRSGLPEIWKATPNDELTGTLAGPPRTIRGIVVIDIVDSKGKKWTSPTVSKMADLIVAAMNVRPLKAGYTVWWICEGTLQSRKGKPHHEFSIQFKDEQGQVTFEQIVIRSSTLRKLVAAGKMPLADAIAAEKEVRPQ